jgi:hypothetical protein
VYWIGLDCSGKEKKSGGDVDGDELSSTGSKEKLEVT